MEECEGGTLNFHIEPLSTVVEVVRIERTMTIDN